MVLHAHKLCPAMLLCSKLHTRELRRPHTARSNISDLPALNEIVQSFHRFFDGDEGVEAVDLEEVDVWRIEACE